MQIHKTENFQTNNVEIAACAAPRPMLLISDGDDWTKNTPTVEFPHLQYIYGLFNRAEAVENVHLPTICTVMIITSAAAYPFLAKHLGLDITKAVNPDGSLNERISLSRRSERSTFDEKHPFPNMGSNRMMG